MGPHRSPARRLWLAMLAAAALAAGALVSTAPAHQSGCHAAHSCPSDHHTYVWFDSAGQGWDCAKPDAAEVGPADTTTITYDGLTYSCHPAGSLPPPTTTSAPPPAPTTTTVAAPPPPPVTTTPTSDATSGQSGAGDCVLGRLPDDICTPGDWFSSVGRRQVCKPGYARRARRVSQATKDAIYAEYGVLGHRPGQYEVDHLVPLELGGSNSNDNLWVEAASPRPGFHEKDRLENRLHGLVCSGRMTLSRAQRLIADNWVSAYRRYVKR